jgi:diacylglycerol kinase family enzyme
MAESSLVSIAIVLNPNARRVRHEFEERARRLQRITGPHGKVYATRTLEELRGAVEELMQNPPDFVVTDGGDGTLHWVLNEAKKHVASVSQVPPLLPTNGGTIDFVARKVGVRGNAESIVRELVKKLDRGSRPSVVEIDSLILTGKELDENGALVDFSRLGFALAAGGIGQRFFSKYYSERELGRGAIVRVVAKAVASRIAGQLHVPLPDRMLKYGRDVFAPTHATVSIDGEEVPGEHHGAIHAGSIDVSLGGVFKVFPLAKDRGSVHFQAGEIVPSEIIRALPALARGGAIPSERLREVAGAEMRISAIGDESLAPIIDGEAFTGLRELIVRPGPRIKVPRIRA